MVSPRTSLGGGKEENLYVAAEAWALPRLGWLSKKSGSGMLDFSQEKMDM